MRRLMVVLFALTGLSRASLEAQTCHGLAVLPSGQPQVQPVSIVLELVDPPRAGGHPRCEGE